MPIHSKRSHEGYLLIDNRQSPGVPVELLQTVEPVLPPGASVGMFEAPTITCKHCQKVLVLNPLRTRDRAWCQKCDHYICDECGAVLTATGICKTFEQIIDEAHEQVIKGGIILG